MSGRVGLYIGRLCERAAGRQRAGAAAVSGFLDAIYGWFLRTEGVPHSLGEEGCEIEAGARQIEAPFEDPPKAPSSATVLGEEAAAIALGCIHAGELRVRGDRSYPAALVLVWSKGGVGGPSSGLSSFGARRLATRLQERGLNVNSRGSIVWVALDCDPDVARREIERIRGVVEVPVVTVISGGRPLGLEEVIAESESVLVVLPAWASSSLADLAIQDLPGRERDSIILCHPLAEQGGRFSLSGFRALGLTRVMLQRSIGRAASEEMAG